MHVFGTLFIATLRSARAATAGVTVDFDHRVSFSKYRTYSWGGRATGDCLWDRRLKEVVDEELAANGWKEVPSQRDVVVSAFATAHRGPRLEINLSLFGTPWAQSGSATVPLHAFPAGTLVVDIADTRTRSLVWRSVASGTPSFEPDGNDWKLDAELRSLIRRLPQESSGT